MEEHNQPKEPADLVQNPAQNSRATSAAGVAALFLIVAAGTAAAFTLLSEPVLPQAQTAAAPVPTDYFADISVEAKAAVVIDIQSGKTLYEKNADAELPLASLTKVALALAVAEALPANSLITIPYYAAGADGSEHLLKGERWSVSDVVDFTLIASSNSGARILADATNAAIHDRFPQSPADEAALWRMNDLAKSLGLQSMFFLNVSGLDLSASQAGAYGSAHDVASLFAYAASAEPSLFAGTARDGVLLTSPNGRERASAQNTNEAQGAISGLIMGKTGLTDLAGGNLAIVFDVGLAHPVVAVVLGSSEKGRFSDMQRLVAATRKTIGETQ